MADRPQSTSPAPAHSGVKIAALIAASVLNAATLGAEATAEDMLARGASTLSARAGLVGAGDPGYCEWRARLGYGSLPLAYLGLRPSPQAAADARVGPLDHEVVVYASLRRTRKQCEQAEGRIRVILARLGLELHPEKTRRAA